MYNLFMVINSISNNTLKDFKNKKKEKDFIFIDNPKIIDEAINAKKEIYKIIISENKIEKFKKYLKFQHIIVSENIINVLSSIQSSQGVCALIKYYKKAFKPPQKKFLVLDEVQDPGNVGTLIRSAVAFNYKDIYLIDSASISNEKVVRSTMGAIFKANIYELNRQEFIENFKNTYLYCGDLSGEDVNKIEINEDSFGIVIGNEGRGVSDEIKNMCKKITIKMDNQIESLNASIAGGILMYVLKNKGDMT